MSDKSRSGGGVGFAGLLTVLFIGLKLTGHVDWSWWWVLAPLWAPAAVAAIVLVFGYALMAMGSKPK